MAIQTRNNVDGRLSKCTWLAVVASVSAVACLAYGNLEQLAHVRIAIPSSYEIRWRGTAADSRAEEQVRNLAEATGSHGGSQKDASTRNSSSPARVCTTLDYDTMAGGLSQDDTFEAACKKTGQNVGNLVWLYAASKVMLDPEKNVIMTPKTRNGRVDAMIVPSANLIYNMSELQQTQNTDEKLRKFASLRPNGDDTPRFILGIGVRGMEDVGLSTSGQPSDLGETYITPYTADDYFLHSQYVKTLGALGKDAGAIGVRGAFTEQVLRNYGIDEAIALGCPSLFLNSAPNLGAIIQEKIANLGPSSRIAINLPQRWVPRLVTYLLGLALQGDNVIVWQSLWDLWFIQRAEKELGIYVPPERIHWFRDFESWSALVCSYDALIGPRIHGNMIGVTCPTPMLLIALDIRTQEMGAGMKIPMLLTNHTIFQTIGPLLEASQNLSRRDLPSITQMFAAAEFDGVAFDRNRYLQASRYKRIFSNLNIVPSERIIQLAALHK